MYIILKFDINRCAVFIPDGYITSLQELQFEFLEWCHDQKESIVCAPGGILGYQYSGDMFLNYINEVVLANSAERAYFVDIDRVKKKNAVTISF